MGCSQTDKVVEIISSAIPLAAFDKILAVAGTTTIKSKFKDIDSGFKIISKKALKKITEIEAINSDFLSAELCLKLQYYKFNFVEIPVKYFHRKEDSKALNSNIPASFV